MDNAILVALAASAFFVTASVVLNTAAIVASEPVDRRSSALPRTRLWSTRNNVWATVNGDSRYDQGWFKANLRCSCQSFEIIAGRVKNVWTLYNKPLGNNTVFSIEERVAVTLHYLASEGTMRNAGSLFGMSKTSTVQYVRQVVKVLKKHYLKKTIRLPRTIEQWEAIAAGFEAKTGFPRVLGAIDGSLFNIHRFANHQGWYCRKFFPAFNLQAIVDHRMRFMSYSLRSGSSSDQGLYNKSEFGRTIASLIPRGHFFLADAGYRLLPYILIPYRIYWGMPKDESHYNYIHSKTRIVVEQAFGLLKSRFRIFKRNLDLSSPQAMADLIQVSLLLHNWLIELEDDWESPINGEEDWLDMNDDLPDVFDASRLGAGEAIRKRDLVKNILMRKRNQ